MTFHLKSDRYDRKRFPLLKGVTGLFVVLFLVQLFVPKFLPNIFLRAVAPLWSLPQSDDRDQKIAELQAQVSAQALLKQEHEALLRDLGQRVPSDYILGRVLKIPPATLFDTLIINVGEEDAVLVGKRVFVGDMISIGVVSEIYRDTAKVALYSAPGNSFDVLIGHASTSVRATAYGRGAGQFEVVVPREANISVGDPVTIPSITSALFGTIGTVITDPAKAFASAIFLGPVPLQAITRVYVEK